MARPRNTADTDKPRSTAQQLGSLIKSARDLMRKDKGLSTDIDRLPLLTWIMFLKFLDDMERVEEAKAEMRGERHRPVVEAPYRWRDWAAPEDGITGDALIAFVNQEEAVLPTGKRGPGLLAKLRSLAGGNGSARRRRVVAAVFKDIQCRMLSGYILRDVLNKVNGIHFDTREEVFTLGSLYETMLREMRDAAGENGEFYTPRPVVRLMVEMVDPRLGETVLDPACGTGGFLVESFRHLEKQCKSVADRRILQNESLVGGEAKPLPYLLCQMNLLLHGMEAPEIDPENALRHRLTEMGDRDRVDVILTNPPFGGKEEDGIKGNFPADMQTSETALLFLQLIMRRLARPGGKSPHGGRAAVVVPNGTLGGDGVCARIKELLLTNFNLHTIIRLPDGVFSPYTPIPTNILFFDRTGPTRDVWYYEHPLPDGRKAYSKTKPLEYDELFPIISWWNNRKEDEHSWRVPLSRIRASGFDLDTKNPRNNYGRLQDPSIIVKSVAARIDRLINILRDNNELIISCSGSTGKLQRHWTKKPLSEVIEIVDDPYPVDSSMLYPNFGIYSYGRGLFKKEPINGMAASAKCLHRVRARQFIYSRLFAFEGAYGLVTDEFDGYFVSNEYPTFQCDERYLLPEMLFTYFRLPSVWSDVARGSRGLGNRRQRVQPPQVLRHQMWIPPIEQQRRMVDLANIVDSLRTLQSETAAELDALLPSILERAFKGEL